MRKQVEEVFGWLKTVVAGGSRATTAWPETASGQMALAPYNIRSTVLSVLTNSEPGVQVGSQSPQPHLEDGSDCRQKRAHHFP